MCPAKKRAEVLIKLLDIFAFLDRDLKLEIAFFASDLDYLWASTRQCLLNQFADLSVCANQNNFHNSSFKRSLGSKPRNLTRCWSVAQLYLYSPFFLSRAARPLSSMRGNKPYPLIRLRGLRGRR